MEFHWTEPSDKNRYFKTFRQDRISVSGPDQVGVEMYTKILDVCSQDEGERELGGGGGCWREVVWG